MNEKPKTDRNSVLRTALIAGMGLLLAVILVAGFYAAITGIDKTNDKLDEAKILTERERHERSVLDIETRTKLTALEERLERVLKNEDDKNEGLLKAFGEFAREQKETNDKFAAEMKTATDRNAALMKELKELRKLVEKLGDQQAGMQVSHDGLTRNLQDKLETLAKQIDLLRFPPLPDDQDTILEANWTSVGPLHAKPKREHMGVWINWKEAQAAPEKELLAALRSHHLVLGTKLGDVLKVEAIVAKGDDKTKAKSWYAAWKWEEGGTIKKIIAIQVYHDRIRMTWMGTGGSADDQAKIRPLLLQLAAGLGVKNAGPGSYWGPRTGPIQDLYFR